MRGNRTVVQFFCVMERSIPACAGEPRSACRQCQRLGVYPRVCGGTDSHLHRRRHRRRHKGLSPRVRGNRGGLCLSGTRRRSIPACAGEPPPGRQDPGRCRVYPRVCGGTKFLHDVLSVGQGLSPRVRGNQCRQAISCGEQGSIPACAGEPTHSRRVAYLTWVYPRVCGGTERHEGVLQTRGGLSPRVRGNP